MRISRILGHRFRSLFRRSRADADLQREMDIHLQQLVKEWMADGMSEADARLAARREFGPIVLAEEQCRDMRRITFIEELGRDLSFALRALRKSPAFTVTALLSLALGIGANTAIYSFMDAIMLRALPIPEPQNLVVVNWHAKGQPAVVHSQRGEGYRDPAGNQRSGDFPFPAWETLREHADVLSALFAFARAGDLNLVAGNQAFVGGGEYVSGNYFSAIGAPPAAGRLFGDADDHAGAAAVAVISHRFWQRAFNGSPNAVGQTILVNRIPFTLAGVAAAEFYGVNPRDSPDIFLPLHSLAALDTGVRNADWFHERTTYWVEMMGRLRPGVTLHQAEAAMAGRFHVFVAATATNEKERSNLPGLWLQEGGSGIDSLRRRLSKPLYILLAMTGLILVIACANIANLLLARSGSRRREIAIRLSLGARRLRIIRQLLTESILLSLLGGLLGLLVTAAGIRFLTLLLAGGREDFTLHAGIDIRILLFTIAVSVVTGVVFGLIPAIQATNVDVNPALKESRVRHLALPFGLNHALVVGQIAISLLLVVAAGLFVKTLVKLHSVSVGFNTQNLLVFNLNAKQAGYDETRATKLYESLRQRFAGIPGVRAATMTDMPLVAGSMRTTNFVLPGTPAAPREHGPSTSMTIIGPSFFETMQLPVLLGRAISERDAADAPFTAVVNEVFAKEYFPGRSPIGQHFTLDYGKPADIQIVGVAKNSLYSSLTAEIPPVAYLPWSQGARLGRGMYFEIRTPGDPLALANTVRQIVRQANAQMPVADLRTQVNYIDGTIAQERTFANLCTCFGFLALLIACVGLYGAMAYAVARRTNEIGIRMALGAQRTRVMWMVQREVLALSCAGLVTGLGIAWQAARFVSSFLFGVRPNDLVVFGVSAVTLLVCALAAGYAPAWRASRIDPMEALRHE